MDNINNFQEEEKEILKEYLKRTSRKNAVANLKRDIETIQQGYRQIWSSGFQELDKKLDGGFHPKQLTFIGATSSLGKTSLALQIADNVARSGKDVLIFSLEMDSDELLAKSISRETYNLSCGDTFKEKQRLTTQDILNGEIGSLGDPRRELFDEALEKTQQIDDHLFYLVGQNDINVDMIETTVQIHQRARGQAPLVIVDYLQIMRPSDEALNRKLDKRLITDDDVTRFRVMARDYQIPVIVISAFNRESYLSPVTMASFKESSGIEYSSDVLLGLQYQNFEYKKIWTTSGSTRKKITESKKGHEDRVRDLIEKMDVSETRPLELKILKQRNGKKGSVFFDFVAPYNVFIETGTDEKKPDGFILTLEEDEARQIFEDDPVL